MPGADIDLTSWTLPPVFGWMRDTGGLDTGEMLKTFNSGIGMVIVVDPDRADAIAALLGEHGETVARLGSVTDDGKVTYRGALS